jgi:hypothetical protein
VTAGPDAIFEYELQYTEDDFRQWAKVWMRDEPSIRVRMRFGPPAIVALCFLIGALAGQPIVGAILGIALAVFMVLLLREAMTRQLLAIPRRAARYYYGTRTRYRFSPTHFDVENDFTQASTSLELVRTVYFSPTYVFIPRIDHVVMIVPRRVFSSDDEWNRFRAFATQLKASKT